MRILLDTNIIIHREANKVINQDIGILFNWLDRLHYTKCVHPLTIAELNRHLDPVTVKTMHAKVANYQMLQTPAPLHADVAKVSAAVDTVPNDIDDTKLLNEVYCDRVHVLISEDKKLHKKAALLNISDRVFRIEDFLEKLIAEHPDFVDYKVLAVKREYFGNIRLTDIFFDSFRNDYPGFDKWFNSKAGNSEKAYVCYEGGQLKAYWDWRPHNRPFVINFLYAFSFKKGITLKQMLEEGILPSMDSVKTINKMSWDAFEQLIKLSGI